LKPIEIFSQSFPIGLQIVLTQVSLRLTLDGSRGIPLPQDLGGNTLSDFALSRAIHQQRIIGVAVDIDKARAYHQPFCINNTSSPFFLFFQSSHLNNLIALDGKVGREPEFPRTIQDISVANNQVKLVCGLLLAARYKARHHDQCIK